MNECNTTFLFINIPNFSMAHYFCHRTPKKHELHEYITRHVQEFLIKSHINMENGILFFQSMNILFLNINSFSKYDAQIVNGSAPV